MKSNLGGSHTVWGDRRDGDALLRVPFCVQSTTSSKEPVQECLDKPLMSNSLTESRDANIYAVILVVARHRKRAWRFDITRFTCARAKSDSVH